MALTLPFLLPLCLYCVFTWIDKCGQGTQPSKSSYCFILFCYCAVELCKYIFLPASSRPSFYKQYLMLHFVLLNAMSITHYKTCRMTGLLQLCLLFCFYLNPLNSISLFGMLYAATVSVWNMLLTMSVFHCSVLCSNKCWFSYTCRYLCKSHYIVHFVTGISLLTYKIHDYMSCDLLKNAALFSPNQYI